MSTLTKVLIVLLTVFSIFLCGIVVTYVANAENQKERADGLQRNIQAARSREADAQQQLEESRKQAETEKASLDRQIADLGVQIKDVQGKLADTMRERDQLVQKVATMAAAVETSATASKQQTTLFEAAQQEVQSLRAEQANRKKELDETNQMLLDKMAVIAQLQDQVRRLTEQSQDVTSRLNRNLQQYGQTALTPATTVAQRNAIAQPVPSMSTGATTPQTRAIALNGQVTEVDNKNKLAAISIGATAGVRQQMKFHIIRGDRVVADMSILDVEPDRAVGLIQAVQQGLEPRVGDRVSTNL